MLRASPERDDARKHTDRRDGDVPRADAEPGGSLRIVSVTSTAFQFMSGSPIPMNTMFVTLIGGSSRRISRTCPAISNASRLRLKPIAPVAQNAHCSAQPACDEMHSVTRSPSGIATVSIASPSCRRKRNFSVPSADFCRAATVETRQLE